MKNLRSKNLERSVFLSLGIIVLSFYFFWDTTKQKILLILAFVTAELLGTMISGFLIVLRLKNKTRYKFSFAYQLCGTLQLFLALTDIMLLIVNNTLTRQSLLIFLSVNFFISAGIFSDIYRTNSINKNH